jgi:anti-sigma factor RsiW
MTAEHLDEGTVQQLLHDEVPHSIAPAVRAHLDACAECRDRLAEAHRVEAELFDRLTALDDATPLVTRDHTVAARDATLASRRASGAQRDMWRWAAGILLVIGASGVAYAAPGSPLRWLVARVTDWIRTPGTNSDRDPVTPTVPDAGGVMIDPGEHAVIDLRLVQPSDTLRVMLVDAAQIAVRSAGGLVTFESDPDRLSVSNTSGTATIEVLIPRTAPRVEIVTGGRQLYLKEGSTISSIAADTTGGRHVILPARR